MRTLSQTHNADTSAKSAQRVESPGRRSVRRMKKPAEAGRGRGGCVEKVG